MLTEDQIQKLEPLMEHPIFGQLLKDAVEVWKREDVIPVYGHLGMDRDSGESNWNFIFNTRKACCLLGAAIYGKNISIEEYIKSTFRYGIVAGFDSVTYHSDENEEAKKFASEVRKIVNPVHYSKL